MQRMLRRGVLMTASSRRSSRPAWLEEEEGPGDGQRGASNAEWKEIEREVREERRRIFAEEEFKSGRRGAVVVAYDDVAEEAEEVDRHHPGADDGDDSAPEGSPRDDEGAPNSPHSSAAGPAAAASATEAPAGAGDAEETPLPPEGAVTAGQAQRERKRGGKKKTGAQRRREAEEREEEKEGGSKKKKKKRKKGEEEEEEDPDRWIKLKLQGDQKSKRIDATRIVVYHDFDNTGARSSHQEAGPLPAGPDPPKPNNFRAQVRALYEDDDDD